jgi:hypothetical protein
MSITNALASVAVKDLRSTALWYEKTISVVMIKDPDGNSIAFAQALDARWRDEVEANND